MIKKVKEKVRFYKSLLFEVIETLCSICLYLETEGRFRHNPKSQYMRGHFDALKGYSEEIRNEIVNGSKKARNERIDCL